MGEEVSLKEFMLRHDAVNERFGKVTGSCAETGSRREDRHTPRGGCCSEGHTRAPQVCALSWRRPPGKSWTSPGDTVEGTERGSSRWKPGNHAEASEEVLAGGGREMPVSVPTSRLCPCHVLISFFFLKFFLFFKCLKKIFLQTLVLFHTLFS